jgi:hypothetical protein
MGDHEQYVYHFAVLLTTYDNWGKNNRKRSSDMPEATETALRGSEKIDNNVDIGQCSGDTGGSGKQDVRWWQLGEGTIG